MEPNDDGGTIAPRRLGRRSRRRATVDYWDDPVDVYAVRVRVGQRLSVRLHGPGVKGSSSRSGSREPLTSAARRSCSRRSGCSSRCAPGRGRASAIARPPRAGTSSRSRPRRRAPAGTRCASSRLHRESQREAGRDDRVRSRRGGRAGGGDRSGRVRRDVDGGDAARPFLPLASASVSTERVTLGTAIATAFTRSPMVTAMTAWDLQRAAGGGSCSGSERRCVRTTSRRLLGAVGSARAPAA